LIMGKPDPSISKIQNRINVFKIFSIRFLNRVQTGSPVMVMVTQRVDRGLISGR